MPPGFKDDVPAGYLPVRSAICGYAAFRTIQHGQTTMRPNTDFTGFAAAEY
jgi:hypothetical protein